MDQLRRVLDELTGSGAERGLQVAVYRRGEPVVDVAAGVADPATDRPVTPSTVFNNFSIVKAATATLAHVLVERGAFGYDTPLARLWPEFGVHGKSGITVRHVLAHSAGLAALPPDTTPEDLCDRDRMCALVADAEPRWPPGTRVGYHAYTFGFLIGELTRRATGEPISRLLRTEITEPLGVADELYFGMPASAHGRLARLEGGVPGGNDAVPPKIAPTAEFCNRPDVLAADIPASGKTSARATARLYAALLDGTFVPVRRLTTVAAEGTDAVLGNPSSWSLGFALGITGPASFGMAGAGGGLGYADPATGIAFALTKNRLTADLTAFGKISRAVAASPRGLSTACGGAKGARAAGWRSAEDPTRRRYRRDHGRPHCPLGRRSHAQEVPDGPRRALHPAAAPARRRSHRVRAAALLLPLAAALPRPRVRQRRRAAGLHAGGTGVGQHPGRGLRGGLVLPALLYLAFEHSGPAAAGWGVPMSTDTRS